MDRVKKDDYAKSFGPSFNLDAKATAFLVIDLQNASANRNTGLGKLLKDQGKEDTGKWRFDRIENTIIPNVQKILKFFRDNKLKIIYITLGAEKDDFSDVPPHLVKMQKAIDNRKGTDVNKVLAEIKPLPDETVINKNTFSAFVSTNINDILKQSNIKNVICCGVSTNSCVLATAMNAADHGYNTLLIEDACGAAAEKFHEDTINNFARLSGRVDSTDTVLEELSKTI